MSDAAAAAAVSPAGGRGAWRRVKLAFERHSLGFFALLLSLILVMMVLSQRIFINIPAGHVGVLWLRFFGGTVTDRYYGEGIQLIFPWDEMYIYDARLQNNARVYDTISSNGLSMQVEIAVRYRINRDAVGLLHKLVGPNYPEILVYPETGSHARELISSYTPEQLYSETRAFIQAQILERMVTQLGSSLINQSVRGKLVNVEDVLIRSVNLPARIQSAIERKAEQYQAMLEYDFRIVREKKERERKQIEAEGVRDFQTIVAKSITNEYLRLRGIEATMSLATSPNSKVIIIGGKDGLPIILNTGGDMNAPGTPAGPMSVPGEKAAGAIEPPSTNARLQDVPPPNAATPVNQPPQAPEKEPAAKSSFPDTGTRFRSPSSAVVAPSGPSLPASPMESPAGTPPAALKDGESSAPPEVSTAAPPESEGSPAEKESSSVPILDRIFK